MKTAKDPRHQTRRIALSLIYSQENVLDSDYSKISDELIPTICIDLEIHSYDKKFLKTIMTELPKHIDEIKEIVSKNSNDWDLNKIYKIDISILMIAIWEIKYIDTPHKVVVDEAVELAKEFGGTESPKFVNGILSGVLTEYE